MLGPTLINYIHQLVDSKTDADGTLEKELQLSYLARMLSAAKMKVTAFHIWSGLLIAKN